MMSGVVALLCVVGSSEYNCGEYILPEWGLRNVFTFPSLIRLCPWSAYLLSGSCAREGEAVFVPILVFRKVMVCAHGENVHRKFHLLHAFR